MTKTVLITGCSTGIGSAAARRFSESGWSVLATMRDPSRGTELALRSNVEVVQLDVTDQASIDRAIGHVADRRSTIDALVNNAGLGLFGPFETSPWDLIETQIATNTLGVMRVTRAVLPFMRAQGAGVIVNVTSVGGLTTMPLNSVYHAAKFATDGFSEALHYELDPLGIRVKVVAPGGVTTPFTAAALGSAEGLELGAYEQTVAKVRAAFTGRGGAYSTPEQVAEVICAAATDGTDQVRYVVGADAEYLLKLRAENTTEEYLKLMSARFQLSSG